MKLPKKLSPLRVHFIGIGGIGISALTRWFLAQKWAVTGSDAVKSDMTSDLQKQGVKVKIGHKSSNLPNDTDLVIWSPAIPPQNPELKKARHFKIKTLSYPEALGRLTKTYDTIAVSGSHGKSTTTAIVSLILQEAGFNPNVILGTKLKEFGNKNFRQGESDWLVIEADEWQASFLNHSPFISIVTNIDREHLDFYKNLSNLKSTFLKFVERTREGGALILNRDDKNLYSLRLSVSKIAKTKRLKTVWYSSKIRADSRKILELLRIHGEHNLSNAMAAFTLAKVLKIKEPTALKAMRQYRGAWRRMEYRGIWHIAKSKSQKRHKQLAISSALVYDDYAHHPTEIKATLKAFKEKFPKRLLICVYQPHQAKRLALLFDKFRDVFSDADITLVLPIYEVLGRDIANPKPDSKTLVRSIQKEQPEKLIFYLANLKNLKKALSVLLLRKSASGPRKSALVVMMGAGDIVDYTKSLL